MRHSGRLIYPLLVVLLVVGLMSYCAGVYAEEWPHTGEDPEQTKDQRCENWGLTSYHLSQGWFYQGFQEQYKTPALYAQVFLVKFKAEGLEMTPAQKDYFTYLVKWIVIDQMDDPSMTAIAVMNYCSKGERPPFTGKKVKSEISV